MARKGSALLFITTLAGLLILIAIIASVNAVSDVNVTTEEKARTKLEFACESGLNRAKAKIEQSFNNSDLNSYEPLILFQGTSEDATGLTPEEKAFEDETFVQGATDYYTFTLTGEDDTPDIEVRYSIKNAREDDADGWKRSQGFTTNKMLIEAVAYAPNYGWIGMKEIASARRTSLLLYQIFFEDELEILPGANFNLTGLIHTNKDMYLNSEATLSIYTDSLTAAGNIYRGRLDSNTVGGTVKISKKDMNGGLVTMSSTEDSENKDWVDIATSKWGGSVKDKSLGATRQEAPNLHSFQPGGYYNQNASISITVNPASSKLYSINCNGVTKNYTASELGSALSETQIYDYREYPSGYTPSQNKPVKLTNVDVNALRTKLASVHPGYNAASDNGLVYMTRTDAVADNDGNPYAGDPKRNVTGFKLINGSTLNNATTFVSNNPVYVHKNFNVHTSTNPALDKWKPCAVISDAITLLSNSWVDADSNWKDKNVTPKVTPQLPTASNTEFNIVLITGNVPTRPGQYSGGFENFPRFLENWSGKNVNISGGFIQLFRSMFATGPWVYGDYYTAPNRNWQSEPRFNDLSALPPDFVNLFPSTAIDIIYSGWNSLSRDETDIGDFSD